MKKFAVIENMGKHDHKHTIYCEVIRCRVVEDSDNFQELIAKYPSRTEYRDDGYWYSYSVLPRKWAKRDLAASNNR